MTRDDTKKILMRIQSVFPNWKPAADLRFVVDTWCEYLDEYSYEQVLIALKAYISTDTSGFAPSIGQLVDRIHNLSCPCELNEMEAWSLVSKAIRNSYYNAETEFEKLPDVVKKAVGSPSNLRNWSQTDIESIENVVQSNFIRTYRIVLKREKENRKLPESVRIAMNQNLSIEQKGVVE